MPVIDVHSHIEIAECFDRLPKQEGARSAAHGLSAASAEVNERMYAAIRAKLCDPGQKLLDMEMMGVEFTVLSPSPFLFFYDQDPKLAADLARLQNEKIAAVVRAWPQKFAGLANLPLQDVRAAVSELDYAVGHLKLAGAEIGSNVQGRYLGHSDFRPFWEKVQALDVPVFIHPHQVAGVDRLGDFYFSNLVGNLLDTTLAAAHLIFSGVLDEYPRLKIILAHGGGQLSFIIGRLDHGHRVRPECQGKIRHSPAEYLRRFHFDTITHERAALRYLISRVGVDRVVMGTDYPYDMADGDPLQTVRSVPDLTGEERNKIRGENAVALFQL